MHKNQHRDLLVLLNKDHKNQQSIEQEVEWLHCVLFHTEELENVCTAHEVIDLNNYKVYTQPHRVKKAILRKDFKAFEFICNKN